VAVADGSVPEEEVVSVDGDAARGIDRGMAYSRDEWMRVVLPAVLLLAMLLMAATVWSLMKVPGPDEDLLADVDEAGSFNLVGHWTDGVTAYGPHARSVNLTLERGDDLSLVFSSNGPPDGIQVRLQHPLFPTDGANGTGGTRVYASAVGGNGSIHLLVEEEGAYQVYFWHPGSVRGPGEGDDPADHTTAAVSYHLVVARAHRP
jgi:hypothetical protein